MRRVFESAISAEHCILENHRVQGLPTLPGLAYVDLLQRVAGAVLDVDLTAHELRRLTILAPLTARQGESIELRTTIDACDFGWRLHVDGISTASGSRTNVVPYAKAELHRAVFASSAKIDVGATIARSSRRLDLAEIYAAAVARNLVHTGLMKASGEIFECESGYLVRLQATPCEGAEFLFHPALLDGAAMATEALRSATDTTLYIPLSLERFAARECLADACYAWIPRAGVRAVNDISTLDIELFDTAGHAIGIIAGLTSKKVRDEAPLGANINASRKHLVTQQASVVVTDEFESILRALFSKHLDLPAAAIDFDTGFFDLGMQSAQMLQVLQDIEHACGRTLSPTLLFEHGSPREVLDHLRSLGLDSHPSSAQDAAAAAIHCDMGAGATYAFHASDGLLRDHEVFGRPALMGVAHPCIALDAASTAVDAEPITLEDIVFSGGPITPEPGATIEIEIEWSAHGTNRSFTTHHAGADGSRNVCCRGRWITAAHHAAADVDLKALLANAAPLSDAEVSGLYAQVKHFAIGPTLRTVEAAWSSANDTLILKVRVDTPSATTAAGRPYLLDPLILNACYFFAGDALAHDRIVVPLAIERLECAKRIPATLFIVKTARPHRSGHIAFDASFYDERGTWCGRIHNASLREVQDPSRLANAQFAAAASPEVGSRDIAIIGLAGRYPQSDTLEEFWNNLRNARDCVSEVPGERWDWRELRVATAAGSVQPVSRWGGFIDDVDRFDPLFFGISPREAACMDPQERLFLEHCWIAMEDAAHTKDSLCRGPDGRPDRRVGVYAGVMSQEYGLFAAERAEDGARFGLPTGIASIANRVSYYFDFRGPSIALDTMCSSSLTAIAMACDALARCDIDAALAGGVNVSIHPNKYLMLTQGGFTSSNGRCTSFGAGGDGYVPSEGVGVVVLRRLDEAVRDGDHIYGVIKAAAINHGGRTGGYTVPTPRAQLDVIQDAWRRAKVDPQRISYIEAHGTGTSLGDPIEIAALTRAFEASTSRRQFCAVGSVKSNIGHCESAAGIAGLTKVLLQLRHKQLVPSLHSARLNPNIDFAQTPFYVPQSLVDWVTPDSRRNDLRLAGLSSFGAGGANAHLLVEEYVRSASPETEEGWLFVLSARTARELQLQTQQLNDAIDSGCHADERLLDIAYTLHVGREAMRERLAVVAGSRNELKAKLVAFLQDPEARGAGVFRGSAQSPNGSPFAIEDDDMRAAIEAWLRKRKLSRLGELWVSGAAIDWCPLYENRQPRRVRLPTYPFQRERHWIVGPRVIREQRDAPSGEPSHDVTATSLLTFEERWVSAELEQLESRSGAPPVAGGVYVYGLARAHDRMAVERALAAVNPTARLIFLVPDGEGADADVITYSLTRESLSAAFAAVSRQVERVDGLFWLHSLGADDPARHMNATLVALQALAASGLRARSVLLAGEWTERSVDRCYFEALVALERSFKYVMPETTLACVLAERTGASDESSVDWWIQRLTHELQRSDIESVLFKNEVRHVCRIEAVPRGAQSTQTAFKQGGRYLVTGGCGGLGFLVAQYLVRSFGAELILLGRSTLDSTREARLRGLRASGARVEYVQCDVADAEALRIALAPVRAALGPLDGVIHAAGIASNGSLAAKEAQDIAHSFAPKIAGTLALDTVLADEPLEIVCYFSSSAAILGDFGACDYSIGNRFQLSYARHRCELGLPGRTMALAWPLWRDGGMDVGDSTDRARFLSMTGQAALDTDEGLELLGELLSESAPHRLVLKGQEQRILASLSRRQVRDDGGATIVHASPRAVATADGRRQVRAMLERIVGEILHIRAEVLTADANLVDLGFDSMTLQALAKQLTAALSTSISPTVFFSHATLEKLADYLAARCVLGDTPSAVEKASPASIEPAVISPAARDRIAIIGMSGRFPGARTIDEMWRTLAEGRHAVEEIPLSRFDWRPLYSEHANATDARTISKWCGAIPGVSEFDAAFFDVAPRDAVAIDPRQRLLMMEAYNALEDAAYGPEQLRAATVGIYVGVEQGGYQTLADESDSITANHDAMLAARLAHFLDLSGPNMAINTACSSGLVAFHQACLSLRARECDTAIVAAANLLLVPEPLIGMTRAGMLSPRGRCAAFDRNADGMVPGEAVVALVVKRLEDAIVDGDPVYATVRASGINYDGRTNGITAPSGAAQTRLLQTVYDRFGVDPGEIEYVVAHGTGTKLGDPVEINALNDAFSGRTSRSQYCALTSTKSNFGHTFAASGLVSLVGLVKALDNELIPPSLHCDEPSDFVDWHATPFYVNRQPKPWRASRRLGAVSSFGMSGTNAHVVLESHRAELPSVATVAECVMLCLSAKHADALARKIGELEAFLAIKSDGDLRAISHTLLTGRRHFRHRCAIVAGSVSEARALLQRLASGAHEADAVLAEVPRDFTPLEASDEEGRALIRGMPPPFSAAAELRNSLRRLAALYCQGHELDWSALSGANPPRRMHLPSYPFSRELHWKSAAPAVPADIAAAPPARACVSEQREKGHDARADMVVQALAERLGMPLENIEAQVPLDEYGLDSISATAVIARIRSTYPEISQSLFLEHNTLAAISQHIRELPQAPSVPVIRSECEASTSSPDTSAPQCNGDVSIIGISARLPGARTLEQFWELLAQRQTRTSELPEARRRLLGLETLTSDELNASHGGYLDDIDCFDYELFKVSRAEAAAMDPQLRKLLECTWGAIADAGYSLADFKRTRTGVFVATRGHSGYVHIQRNARGGLNAETPALYANRISNALDLKGPSEIVDTGCSSFLVAIRQAMAALREERCDQAIVATAQLFLSPFEFTSRSSLSLYTQGTTTRSFGKDSDGYVRGEAIGAIVLKRRTDVERSGSDPYCHIRAVGVCHGGKSPLKWYSPNVEGQKSAIEQALRAASIDASSIEYIEAEANGSQLGDASELIAIQSAYATHQTSNAKRTTFVSTFKPLLGHAESASTLPALLKAMLCVRERRMLGVPGLDELNPGITLAAGVDILRDDRDWTAGDEVPRRAAVHSLSIGGVNAHLILEEAADINDSAMRNDEGHSYIYVYSDRTPELLRQTVGSHAEFLEKQAFVGELSSIAFTLQEGRVAAKCRLAVEAHTLEALRCALSDWLAGRANPHIVSQDDATSSSPARVVAAEWLRGKSVEWGRTRPSGHYRRAHLPPSTLKQERCWHDLDASSPLPEVSPESGIQRIGELVLTPQWVKRSTSDGIAVFPATSRHMIVLCGWPAPVVSEYAQALAPANVKMIRADTNVIDTSFMTHARELFGLIKSVLVERAQHEVFLQVAIPNGLSNVGLHALLALLKTAHKESPRFSGQLVVLDHRVSREQLRLQLEDSRRRPQDAFVQYIKGERWVQSWQEADLERWRLDRGAEPLFRTDRPVVLITGGVGALGLRMAQRIFAAYPQASVFLVGRSALTATQRRQVEQLAAAPSRIEFLRADLSVLAEVEALFTRIGAAAGKCNAIIHCAGVLRDARIVNKSLEDLDAVLAPKVAGLSHLDAVTQRMDLDFVVTFSSVAAVFGNEGQADYSMANAFMDAFASYRNQLARLGLRRGKTLSINWPLWDDGGMSMNDAAIDRMQRDHGAAPLPAELGADLAIDLMACRESQVVVTYGDVTRMRDGLSEWRKQ